MFETKYNFYWQYYNEGSRKCRQFDNNQWSIAPCLGFADDGIESQQFAMDFNILSGKIRLCYVVDIHQEKLFSNYGI